MENKQMPTTPQPGDKNYIKPTMPNTNMPNTNMPNTGTGVNTDTNKTAKDVAKDVVRDADKSNMDRAADRAKADITNKKPEPWPETDPKRDRLN